MVPAILYLPFLCMLLSVSSKVVVQNPSFESPPTNITENTTTSSVLLDTKVNTIPGWSFTGEVWYVTAGRTVSLPGNGHGLRLGPDGRINQTFQTDGSYEYILTFTLAPSDVGCANNSTAVNVSGPGSSNVFFFKESLGTDMWQTHAYSLGMDNVKRIMNLEFLSVSNGDGRGGDANVSCWPVVDSILITGIGTPRIYGDKGVVNSGFEIGPGFLQNSSQGIILDENTLDDPSDTYDHTPIQHWKILGTVKYIDSKHYLVPRGRAAVELVSGIPSGVVKNLYLWKGKKYTVDFIMGDARDSCVGDFTVYVQVVHTVWNFTMRSIGLGSAERHSVTFKAESSVVVTPISFFSLGETRNSDRVLCGPVIDSVVVRLSNGLMLKLHKVVNLCFVLVTALLLYGL